MTTRPTAPLDMTDVAVGYDGSREARSALVWAAEEAVATARRLAVVTAVEPAHYGFDAGSPILRRFLFAEAHRLADPALRRVHQDFPGLDARVVVRVGTPFTAVGQVAREVATLVLGVRHRPAVARLVFGSVAHEVLRTTTSPVVLVPHRTRAATPESVRNRHVVALIGPAAGSGAVDFAIAEAVTRRCPLTVVRAMRGAGDGTGYEETFGAGLEAALTRARETHGELRVEVRGADTTVSGLLDLGLTDDDLLVLGNHEPGEARRLLTDRAVAAVLDHPHCPVAVVADGASVPVGEVAAPAARVAAP